MDRPKKLLSVFLAAAFLFGFLALALPVDAVAAKPIKDPDCKHPCQPTKKHRGHTCVFVGCSTDGRCVYGC